MELSTAAAAATAQALAESQAKARAQAAAQSAELAAASARARDARLKEIQEAIDLKRKDLAAKEAEFQKHQSQVEKNLLELESRRSEILLGKIYTVIQEVARDNGVGVVVDKSQILFGQNSVDLTEKVLKKLEGL
jgi:Skp family chaperone for outer membrane proteins